MADFVPGYEASSLYGVGTPRSTPAHIVEKLNKEINAGLEDPKVAARLTDLGNTLVPGTPGDFGQFIEDDTQKWAKVVREGVMKVE